MLTKVYPRFDGRSRFIIHNNQLHHKLVSLSPFNSHMVDHQLCLLPTGEQLHLPFAAGTATGTGGSLAKGSGARWRASPGRTDGSDAAGTKLVTAPRPRGAALAMGHRDWHQKMCSLAFPVLAIPVPRVSKGGHGPNVAKTCKKCRNLRSFEPWSCLLAA